MNSLFYKCRRTQVAEEVCLENKEGCKNSRAFESFRRRQRASVRKFYMYYCSIIRLIGNVSMDMSKSKHLVVQFTENLKECEHNMAHWWRRVSRLPVTQEDTSSSLVWVAICASNSVGRVAAFGEVIQLEENANASSNLAFSTISRLSGVRVTSGAPKYAPVVELADTLD